MEDDITKFVSQQIWARYDPEDRGYLTKSMAKRFMVDSLCDGKSGSQSPLDLPVVLECSMFTEKELDELYCELDRTGSGRVSKVDMVQFFKNVAGL